MSLPTERFFVFFFRTKHAHLISSPFFFFFIWMRLTHHLLSVSPFNAWVIQTLLSHGDGEGKAKSKEDRVLTPGCGVTLRREGGAAEPRSRSMAARAPPASSRAAPRRPDPRAPAPARARTHAWRARAPESAPDVRDFTASGGTMSKDNARIPALHREPQPLRQPENKRGAGSPCPAHRTGGRDASGRTTLTRASACCAAFRDPISPEPGEAACLLPTAACLRLLRRDGKSTQAPRLAPP